MGAVRGAESSSAVDTSMPRPWRRCGRRSATHRRLGACALACCCLLLTRRSVQRPGASFSARAQICLLFGSPPNRSFPAPWRCSTASSHVHGAPARWHHAAPGGALRLSVPRSSAQLPSRPSPPAAPRWPQLPPLFSCCHVRCAAAPLLQSRRKGVTHFYPKHILTRLPPPCSSSALCAPTATQR